METLNVLKLSVPALDSKECKAIMGGDGYYDNGNVTDLTEVVITPNDDDSGFDPDLDPDLDNREDVNQDGYEWDDSREDGDHGSSDLPSVDDVINTLPEKIQEYVRVLQEKGKITIEFSSTIIPTGEIHISKDGNATIYLGYEVGYEGNASWYTNCLIQELAHYYQHELGLDDIFDKNSPLEFLENVMGWLYSEMSDFLGDEGTKDFEHWIDSIKDEQGRIDLSDFLDNISDWYDDFINYQLYKGNGDYTDDSNYDYHDMINNMNWEDFFDWYDIPYVP